MPLHVEPAWAAAELVEAEAMFAMNTTAPSDVRGTLGMSAVRVGGGSVTVMRHDPMGGVWNRAIGLGLREPLTEEVVDEALAVALDNGAPLLVVQVAPYAEPADWPAWMEARGLIASATWAKFVSAPEARTGSTEDGPSIDKLGPDEGTAFAHALLSGFEIAPEQRLIEWIAALASAGDPWHAYGIREGGELVAAGWMFRGDETASLLAAATLPEHRRRGFHRALVRRRMADAAAMGCTLVASETGSDTAASPNPAVRSLESAGLPEVYQRRNWIWRSPA